MSSVQPGSAPTPVNRRQRFLGLAVVVAVALVLGLAVAALRPPRMEPGAGAPGVAASATLSPSPSIPPQARTTVWTSNTRPTGQYRLNSTTAAPAVVAPATKAYVVKVETSVPVDVDDVAASVHATLNDDRGWVGYRKTNFRLVAAEGKGVLTIYLASPKTADKLCLPAKTDSKWSCRVGNRVVLNSDRWQYMTPTYSDLAAYRAYLVNHEVGHYLGQGHATCPKKGGRAPVMMQQSVSLDGCLPNAWPRTSD